MFVFHSSPRDCPSKTRCNTLSMLKSQLSLCGTGLNHRRLQQSMLLPIPEHVFILCIGFFTDSGRCFWGRNYRFCILCIPSGLYIYIFTHAFLHIPVQLEGESILTAEMLGSILTGEMLVKTISRGKHSNCWNAGRKQFQGGNIPTAEMLVKKHFQPGNIPTDEMLVKKHFKGGRILTAEMLVKSNFNGEAF